MTDNIATALHAVYQKVGYVQKERPKAGSGLAYSYASEKALIEHLRPALLNAGIVVYVAAVVVELRESYTNKQGTLMNRTCINATVRFTHAASGTHVDVQALGEGTDAGDKSTPKAITGAYKYALRQTFCIETGDDPDQAPSAEQERKEKPKAIVENPATLALRSLYAVAKEKGMGQADLHEFIGADSLKVLAEHMMEPKNGCDMPHPHDVKDYAAAYGIFRNWVESR